MSESVVERLRKHPNHNRLAVPLDRLVDEDSHASEHEQLWRFTQADHGATLRPFVIHIPAEKEGVVA
jgi:hypothetical protein